MGRTAPTYRQALEARMKRWDDFGRLLTTPEERAAFEALRRGARRYVAQATNAGNPDLLESLLLSILLDLSCRFDAALRPGPPRPPSRPS